jgi:hypothetical protein
MSTFNSRFQYPHNTPGEKRALALAGGSQFMEFLLAARKWRAFYMASLRRSIRFFSDRYNHIDFHGHVDIPDSFGFDESRAKPRGIPVNGKYYSQGYDIAFEDMPEEIRTQALAFRSILESFFASEVNIGSPHIWRNLHVPAGEYSASQEVFSDGFHQDLVVDQFNTQIFFLLQETTEEHGPFEYLQPDVQRREMHYYRKRDRKTPLTASSKLTGHRGDYFLFSTGTTLHRANNPGEGKLRDIMSIPFFPAYTGIGRPMKSLAKAED